MKQYLVLGKKFEDFHDRAIRFTDQSRVIKIAKETDGSPDLCDKCRSHAGLSIYHVIKQQDKQS